MEDHFPFYGRWKIGHQCAVDLVDLSIHELLAEVGLCIAISSEQNHAGGFLIEAMYYVRFWRIRLRSFPLIPQEIDEANPFVIPSLADGAEACWLRYRTELGTVVQDLERFDSGRVQEIRL